MNDAIKRARAPQVPDEELETGEPLPDEPPAGRKKIPAHAGRFAARAPGFPAVPDAPDAPRREPPAPPTGQMVLTTAKYMPAQPSTADQLSAQARGEQAAGAQATARGMWTGMLMMAVAVIWFGAGLADDVIYFFPPVLFVAGVLTFIKGDKGE